MLVSEIDIHHIVAVEVDDMELEDLAALQWIGTWCLMLLQASSQPSAEKTHLRAVENENPLTMTEHV